MNPVPLQMGEMKRLLRKLIGIETTTQNGELGHSAELSRMSHLDTVGPASNPPYVWREEDLGSCSGRLPVLRQGLRLDERPDEQ